jgi:hypothetical protein
MHETNVVAQGENETRYKVSACVVREEGLVWLNFLYSGVRWHIFLSKATLCV